jgi:hypothetical protein
VVIFFGETDPRAIEDSKRLNLSKKIPSDGLMVYEVAS